jgi:hypothetical protein
MYSSVLQRHFEELINYGIGASAKGKRLSASEIQGSRELIQLVGDDDGERLGDGVLCEGDAVMLGRRNRGCATAVICIVLMKEQSGCVAATAPVNFHVDQLRRKGSSLSVSRASYCRNQRASPDVLCSQFPSTSQLSQSPRAPAICAIASFLLFSFHLERPPRFCLTHS